MKTVNYFPGIVLVLFSFSVITLTGQNIAISGNWTGRFMDQFDTEIEFIARPEGGYNGTLMMFDDRQQIQNDALSGIDVEGDTITFYIEAKSTKFIGYIGQKKDSISGEFIFPDNSRHPLKLTLISGSGFQNQPQKIDYSVYKLSPDQLKSDVLFLSDKMKELHPSLQNVKTENGFEKQVETAIANSDNNLTIYDFYTILAPVTTSVNCSHTGIRLPDEARRQLNENGNYLPLKLHFQNDKIFLISGIDVIISDDYGKEIVKINGKSSHQIINELFTMFPSEQGHLQSKYFEINSKFNDYFVLFDNSDEFTISFSDNTNKIISASSYKKVNLINMLPKQNEQNEFPITFTLDSESSTGYLKIPTFGINDVMKYIGLMDSIFIELNTHKIENLVIDLRGNAGGHPIFAAQLFSYLAKESFTYFDSTNMVEEFTPLYFPMQPNAIHFSGNSYFLIDGGCLSTTGHLISLLKFYNLGTFVGEEPGSLNRCNDGSKQFVLPNSGIELNVPTRVFQTATNGFNENTVVVDHQVSTSTEDIINGTDPYLSAVRKLILMQKQSSL